MFLKSGLMATPVKTGWGERWKLNVKHFTAKTIVSFQRKLSSGVPQECYPENISNADQLIKFAAVLSAPGLLQSTSFSVSSVHSSRKTSARKRETQGVRAVISGTLLPHLCLLFQCLALDPSGATEWFNTWMAPGQQRYSNSVLCSLLP